MKVSYYLRGRPLIIWGAWCKNEKKFVWRVGGKKNSVRVGQQKLKDAKLAPMDVQCSFALWKKNLLVLRYDTIKVTNKLYLTGMLKGILDM